MSDEEEVDEKESKPKKEKEPKPQGKHVKKINKKSDSMAKKLSGGLHKVHKRITYRINKPDEQKYTPPKKQRR